MTENNAETDDSTDAIDFEAYLGGLGDVVRTTPKVRIVIALLSADGDLKMTEILDSADIVNQTFYNNIDELIEAGAIEETRKVGSHRFYDADTTHPGVAIIEEAGTE